MYLRNCTKINLWWSYYIWTRWIRSSRSFKDQKAWFLSFFLFFFCYFYTFWPSYDLDFFYLYISYVFLSLTNDLSLIRYQNNKVTSTRNPTIHIHINKNLWKLLIHYPAFSFFKSHNFVSQVGPDNKMTHARCSKPPNIIQNKILVFILTTSNIVCSVLNQLCTLLHLFLRENHSFFKNREKE